ncbi:EF-hand domain-containing family member A2 [Fasciola gigantica]|uniref:EF-hand domain-containing family member A2 n=1 Tax=Fasciola gigantica TaxID=46835 RepID=A0A504YHU0_FASGI|nr:EF-hand domain-containing family member A2 [Fasciola gigantica]
MQRFLSFASLEYNGEAYMTPVDFIRCAVTFSSAPYGARRVVDQSAFDALVQYTPPLSRSSPTFLQDLGLNGAISFSECMFLLSVISHPRTGLFIAFRMFDRDMNDEVDIGEFKKITRIFCQLCTGELHPETEAGTDTNTTLLTHLFGKKGTRKLRFREFSKFIDNLQTELLRIEFDHFSTGYAEITPVDLGLSLLRFARLDSKVRTRGLKRLMADPDLVGKSISFESYKALYDFLYVIDDFSSALNLFQIAKHSISKEEFQRAARAVTGSPLDPLVVSVIFTLFDADGDGHLSSSEFIDCIRDHGSRHLIFNSTSSRMDTFKRCDPSLRFSYWPRFVARLLRFRPVYRKELLGWRFQSEQPFDRPDRKPNEYREEPYLPVWRFTENPPWNVANRLSEFPYPNITWCVVLPDGKKVAKKLPGMPPDEQLIFKGDRVKILTGPDQGKIGLVSTVLKMRNMVYVDGLNYRVTQATRRDLRRMEQPLEIDSEVALVDPVDNNPCTAVWRYTENGARVRISTRSGHSIPLPTSARQLDDLTDPKAASCGPKDTPTAVLGRITFNPALNDHPITFEDDLALQYGLKPQPKPCPTYWY